MRTPHHQRQAFMVVDMVFGLFIVGVVTITFTIMQTRARQARISLAQTQMAVHLAEHALLNLQHHQPMPATKSGTRLTLSPVTTGTAPAGYVWAQVDAAVSGHHQLLLGVVPAVAMPKKEGRP